LLLTGPHRALEAETMTAPDTAKEKPMQGEIVCFAQHMRQS